MAYTNLAPRTRNITGADLSGSDGATDRTYDIPDTNVLSSGLDIVINGTQLHEGASNDFTLSGETLTFVNNVDDTDVIRINYFVSLSGASTSSISTTSTLKYSSTSQLAQILGLIGSVPSWSTGETPSKEEVGTGDGSVGTFYLDYQNILSDTYTLYYGAAQTTTDELTETTHYTLGAELGKISLTAAGKALVSTDKIFAEYSYVTTGMSDDYLISVLQRAEQEVDRRLNTTFIDGTQDNPSYSSATELNASKGRFDQAYFITNRPLKDVESTLDGDLTAAATSVPVAAGYGDNFPSSGYICIDTEVISYTGITTDTLTGCTRGALTSTAATHSDEAEIHTTILQLSGTQQGTAPTWQTQAWNSDFVAKEDHLYIYKEILSTNLSVGTSLLSTLDVANRVKIIYLYGYDTVPVDITRLTLLLAKSQLVNDTVSSALVRATNEFNPEMTNVDFKEIEQITGTYRINSIMNT